MFVSVMRPSMIAAHARRGMKIVARPSDLVGNTPLLRLDKVTKGVRGTIVGKMESLGPCSSVKDRLGRSMIDEAERAGVITPGKTVLVEPTSGNTGIALAFIARERGYRCILTMPETMSVERRMMLLALGAEVVLTPKETAVPGALAKAHEIVDGLGGDGFMLQQFENPANPKIHRETTGPEIWRDTDGEVDVFVSGVGTGGTVTGVSQFIKGAPAFGCEPKKPSLRTVAVEPQEQMLITDAKGGEKVGPQGPHKIQGMGAGLVPKVLDLELLDEVPASTLIPALALALPCTTPPLTRPDRATRMRLQVQAVSSDDAMAMANRMWLEEGLPVGVSAGAIMTAAVRVMSRPEMEGKLCVAIIPSFGERYFTHPMFGDIKGKAEGLVKQPLPPPFDNTDYGFATARG